MTIITIDDLQKIKTNNNRLLCLDVGKKTIGLAVSDPSFLIATACKTIRRQKFQQDIDKIKQHIEQYHVSALIVGLPLNMDGTEGKQCQSIRDFTTQMLQYIDIPLVFQDERLSSSAVERLLISEANSSRKKRANVIDSLAATWILQGVLDYLKQSTSARRLTNGN